MSGPRRRFCFLAELVRAFRLRAAGVLAVLRARPAQPDRGARAWGRVAGWGETVPTKPRASGSEAISSCCWEANTRVAHPGPRLRPAPPACHWGRGWARGRGCSSGGGFAQAPTGTPPPLRALYLPPLPPRDQRVEGGACLGWPPYSPWKRSVGHASLFLAPGAGGAKAAVVVLSVTLPLGRGGGRGAGGRTGRAPEGRRREAGRGERPPCGSVCVHMCSPAACSRAWLGLARSRLRPLGAWAAGLARCAPAAGRFSREDGWQPRVWGQVPATREVPVPEEARQGWSPPPGRLTRVASASQAGFPPHFSRKASPHGPAWKAGLRAPHTLRDRAPAPADTGGWNVLRAPEGPEPAGEAGGGRGLRAHPRAPLALPASTRPGGFRLDPEQDLRGCPTVRGLGSFAPSRRLKQIFCSWPLSCLVYTSLPDAPRKGPA